MTSLNDDCLLHIFRFLDPITWVTISQVCTTWHQLIKTKLNKITELSLLNPMAYDKLSSEKLKFLETDIDTVSSAMKLIGPYIQSIKLIDNGNCITFGSDYGYHIKNAKTVEQLILMLSKCCRNIVEMKIADNGFNVISIKKLILANTNLTKLILPCENLKMYSSLPLESLEEVVWEVQTENMKNFDWFFPTVTKLTLFINTSLYEAEMIVNTILRFAKNLKSLSVLVSTSSRTKYYFTMLSDVSTLNQLEELRISVRNHVDGSMPPNMEFKVDSVKKLVTNCQNLRIVKFDCISLGLADVSEFFNLPKLEELTIAKANSFISNCLTDPHENLKKLEIRFYIKKDDEEPPCLCEAIEKMPNLKYLKIDGVSEKEAVDLTSRAIKSGLKKDRDVFIKSQIADESMRICKTLNPESKPEQLKLWIKPQGDGYEREVVKNLKRCLILKEEFEEEKRETSLFEQYNDMYRCYEDEVFDEDEIESSEDDDDEDDDEYDSDFSIEYGPEEEEFHCTIS